MADVSCKLSRTVCCAVALHHRACELPPTYSSHGQVPAVPPNRIEPVGDGMRKVWPRLCCPWVDHNMSTLACGQLTRKQGVPCSCSLGLTDRQEPVPVSTCLESL